MPAKTSSLSFIVVCLICLFVPPVHSDVTLENRSPVDNVSGVDVNAQSGSVIQGYTMEIPAGVNTIQPQMTLSYASNQQAGLFGVGWSMEFGSISRSLLRGVPTYTDNDQFDVSMAQEQGHLKFDSTAQYYRPMIEGSFMKFERVGNYWRAFDRAGTEYIFGQSSDARLYDPNHPERIFQWLLERVEDVYGNYMRITYYRMSRIIRFIRISLSTLETITRMANIQLR